MKKLIAFLFALCIINACNSNLENSSKKVNEKDIKSLKTKSGTSVKRIESIYQFDEMLSTYKYVVLFCQVDYCGPCKMIKPYYHHIADEYTYNMGLEKGYLGFAECYLKEFTPPQISNESQHHYLIIYGMGQYIAGGFIPPKELTKIEELIIERIPFEK